MVHSTLMASPSESWAHCLISPLESGEYERSRFSEGSAERVLLCHYQIID